LNRGSGLGGHKILMAVVALAALTLGGVASYMTSRPVAPAIDGLLWPPSKALTAVALEDHRHRPFTLERLKGRWTLLFFGYTHCPDVCPVTLSVLKNALALMAGAGTNTEPPQVAQVVFVSVDPARDTLDHLAAYVGHFSPAFLGVTGDEQELKALARQLGVLYILGDPDADGQYLVDHTAALFLVDPRGHLVALFQAPHDAATIASNIPEIQALDWN
jgi:protein SCO1/2